MEFLFIIFFTSDRKYFRPYFIVLILVSVNLASNMDYTWNSFTIFSAIGSIVQMEYTLFLDPLNQCLNHFSCHYLMLRWFFVWDLNNFSHKNSIYFKSASQSQLTVEVSWKGIQGDLNRIALFRLFQLLENYSCWAIMK